MLALQVGLRNSFYAVGEDDGYLTACVELATPVDREVFVTVYTVNTEIAESKHDSFGFDIELEQENYTIIFLRCKYVALHK